jgi:hypothetical protein
LLGTANFVVTVNLRSEQIDGGNRNAAVSCTDDISQHGNLSRVAVYICKFFVTPSICNLQIGGNNKIFPVGHHVLAMAIFIVAAMADVHSHHQNLLVLLLLANRR